MAQADSQAWWAEVEHLRERIEGRRGEPASGSRSRARSATPARGEHDGRAREASFAPRRTVRIHGQSIPTVTAPRLRHVDEASGERAGAEQPARTARRRPPPRPAERMSASPDRLALMAFGLALLLLLVAAISAHGL